MSDDINKSEPEVKLDLSYLSDVASGSVEFMMDMIDIFIEQTPLYVEQLGAAVKEKNWNEVAGIAHKIKPTLAFMGVNSARDEMEEIEHNARALNNLETIEAKYNKLAIVCGQAFEGLFGHGKGTRFISRRSKFWCPAGNYSFSII